VLNRFMKALSKRIMENPEFSERLQDEFEDRGMSEGSITAKIKDLIPREFDDVKSIRRPRDREIARFMDRFDKLGPILEQFTKVDPIEVHFFKKNRDYAVRHNLGKMPTRIIAGIPDKSSVFYKGSRTWTKQTIYLQSSENDVKVKIYVT